MRDLTKRILTGTAYVTLTLFLLMQSISVIVVFLLIAILATLELKKIFEKQDLDFHTWPTIILGITSYLAVIYNEIKFILFLEIIIYLISLLFQTRKNNLLLAGATLFSIIYIFIPLSLVIPIGCFENGTYNYKLLFGLLFLIWSSNASRAPIVLETAIIWCVEESTCANSAPNPLEAPVINATGLLII